MPNVATCTTPTAKTPRSSRFEFRVSFKTRVDLPFRYAADFRMVIPCRLNNTSTHGTIYRYQTPSQSRLLRCSVSLLGLVIVIVNNSIQNHMRNTNSAIYLYDYLNSGLATSLATNLSPPVHSGPFCFRSPPNVLFRFSHRRLVTRLGVHPQSGQIMSEAAIGPVTCN